MVGAFDVFSGIFKSLFFGAAISLISCHRGFHCAPGAEGVGRAATSAFVVSFVLILALDLLLGIFLDAFYLVLWPEGVSFM
jgi:phospholipid/cholesterol/gamma-HCH transport system permease protein